MKIYVISRKNTRESDDDIRNRGNSSTDKMVFGNGRRSQTTQRSRMSTKTGSRQNGIESNTTSGRTLTNQIKLRKKQSSSMLKRQNSIADSTMTNAENKNTVDLKHSKRKTMNINRTKRIYLNPMKTSQRFVGKRRKRLNHAVTKTSDGTCCKEVQTEELDIEEDEDVDNALATIHAAKTFNPDELCAILHEAIDGFGSEKRTIIRILTSCNNRQRQQLKRVYKKMYKLDLTEELRNELSKIVETGILGLMMEPVEFSVKCLYSSMYGMCPDERLLTYVIVSCSRKVYVDDRLVGLTIACSITEMKSLRKKYKEVFRRDLVNDVKLETNGPHQNVLLSAIEQSDLVGIIDDTNLQVAFKYDVDQPAEIFTEESRHKVRKICVKFSEMSSEDVMKSISHYSEMDSELALLALNNYTVSKLRDPISYIKSCLLEEVDVTTANDILLTYIFTSRAEIDLKDIMKRFKKKYKISLAKAVKKKYSGVLKQLLLATLNPQSFRIK